MDRISPLDGEKFRPYKKKIPARTNLKMLILEADEETLDRIVAAIATVCQGDNSLPQ